MTKIDLAITSGVTFPISAIQPMELLRRAEKNQASTIVVLDYPDGKTILTKPIIEQLGSHSFNIIQGYVTRYINTKDWMIVIPRKLPDSPEDLLKRLSAGTPSPGHPDYLTIWCPIKMRDMNRSTIADRLSRCEAIIIGHKDSSLNDRSRMAYTARLNKKLLVAGSCATMPVHTFQTTTNFHNEIKTSHDLIDAIRSKQYEDIQIV